MKDLVFLVADEAMRQLVRGFLCQERPHDKLLCGLFSCCEADIHLGPPGTYDSGIYAQSHTILTRSMAASYRYAVVMVDQRWGGSPGQDAIRQRILSDLVGVGWSEDRVCAIVFQDDVERWIWMDKTQVEAAIGYDRRQFGHSLREHLKTAQPKRIRNEVANPHWPDGTNKPLHPKQARQWAQHLTRNTKGSEVFYELTNSGVGVLGCQDPEFAHLTESLRRWFPIASGATA